MSTDAKDFLGDALARQQARNAERNAAAARMGDSVSRQQAEVDAAHQAHAERLQAYDDSIVGRIGLDRGGVPSTAANLVVTGAVGAARGAGQVATLADESNVAAQLADITTEELEARDRQRADEQALQEREDLRKRAERQAFKASLGEVSEEAMATGQPGAQGQATDILDPADLLKARQAKETADMTEGDRARLAELEAYAPVATEEDRKVLERITDPIAREMEREARGMAPAAMTVEERLRDAEASKSRAETITEATDFGSLAYTKDSDDLQESLGNVWDERGAGITDAWNKVSDSGMREGLLDLAAKGAGLLVAGAGEFIDNPQGFAQFMAGELGEEVGLAVLPGGRGLMTAANMSRATAAYNAGVENFRKENGRAPDDAEKERLGGYAVLAWALDEVGDTALLHSFHNPVKSGARKLATAGVRVPASVAVDGTSEAGQTFAEGEARYDSASERDIFTAGMLGAGVNAGVSLPSETANAATVVGKAANEQGKRVAGKLTQPAEPTKSERVKEAEKTGDISTISDPTGPGYAPDEALRILVGKTRAEDATEETLGAVREQASTIMQDLEKAAQKAREDVLKRDPARLPEREARLTELKKARALEQDSEAQAQLTQRIGLLESFIAQVKDPEAQKAVKDRAAALEQKLAAATEMQQQLAQDGVRSRQAETPSETVVEQINQTADPEMAKGAVLEMVGRIQASPESFSPEQVAGVLESTSLNPVQRQYLRSFSESQQRANALRSIEGVRSDILEGGKEFAGIAQYRARVNEQLKRDDKAQARKTLSQLQTFTKRHTAKAQAVASALKEVQGTDKVIGLVYDAASGWQRTEKLTPKEQQANGGLNVSNNTARIAASIEEEAALLRSASKELILAYRMANAPADVVATTQQPNSEEAADEASTDSTTEQPAQEEAETEGPAEPAGTVDATDGGPTRVSATSEVNEAGQEFDPETGEILNEDLSDPEPTAEEVADRWTQDEGIEPYGKLRPLTEAVKAVAKTLAVTSETFGKINLVQRFMDQRRKRPNGKALPLVEVENLLSELDRDPALAEEFLGREMTPKEENALAAFLQVAEQWKGWVEDSLPVKDEEKSHIFFRDPIKFLMQEGALEENVVTAIVAAAYDHVTTAGVKGTLNNEKAINKILGRPEDHPVSPSEVTRFSGIGQVRADAANTMGYQILDTLGFTADSDAPMQLRETLASSLGARAMALLVDTGVLEQTEVTAAEMQDITGDAKYVTSVSTNKQGVEVRTGPSRFFVKPTQQERGPGRETLDIIQEAGEASLTLLPELLGLQSGVRIPGFQPVGFRQARAKNSNRGVPGPLAKILEAEGNKPHYLRQDALRAWQALSLSEKKLIAGAVDPGARKIQKANRDSLDAKNADIERQIENFDRFVEMVEEEGGLDQPFFMNREVWKMQRVGLTDTLVNPQASKIHRHLISMGGWEITVDMTKAKSMEGFHMALAEAYGVKTDKQSVEMSVAQVKAIMAKPEIMTGVEALQAREAGATLSPEQRAAIVTAAKSGKENYYSLEGLIAQAKYQTASDSGQLGFTVHLSREVDGKTNGPMLGQWQLGAAADADELLDTAIMGGFFDGRSGHTQVNDWASEPGKQDLYQRTASHIAKRIQASIKEKPGRRVTFAAIEYFTGTLYDHANEVVTKEGRNLVKNPVTILMFGASMAKIQDNVTDGLIHQIYDRIEAMANDPATTRQDVATLVQQVNQLLGFKNEHLHLSESVPMEVLMEKEFREAETDAIASTLKWSLNGAIKDTMETDFEAFIERRNQLNKATKTAFLLYEAAYRQERRKKVAELIENGEMPVSDRTGLPLRDLTAPEEAAVRAEIRDMEPVIHSAFSQAEGNLANGIYLAKREKEYGSDSLYGVQASFPQGFGKRKDGKGYKYMEITGNHWTDIEPGVSPMILALHSLDSFIAASSYAEHQALNVHDALINGFGGIEATAKTLNQNTLKGLMNYSIPGEMASALERTAQAFADRYSAEDIAADPEFAADYASMWEAVTDDQDLPDRETLNKAGQDPLGYLVDKTRTEARKADLNRLQGLRKLISIDQYSLPGGNYVLTDEDYAAIDAMIAAAEAVPSTTNAELVGQLKELTDALSDVAPDATVEQAAEPEPTPLPKSGETAWGKLGRSRFTHDPALVAYLEGNPEGTAGELLRFLNEHVKTVEGRNTRDFYRKLIAGLYASVDRSLPVRYLSESTPYDSRADQRLSSGSFGAYIPGERARVYMKGTDYRQSQVSVEVVLHELVHAVTADVLRNQSDRPEIMQVKKDLETLLDAVRKEVSAQELAAEKAGTLDKDEAYTFRYATSSIDELIAVGTSDRNFQRKVLNKVQVATGTRQNPLLSGMRSLIASIVKLVFRGSDKSAQELRENGLAVLIANVSMLAEENRQRINQPAANDDAEQGLADSLENRAREMDDMGYLDLYDGLGTAEDAAHPADQARVRALLSNLSQAIHGPFEGFRDALRAQEATGTEDVLIKTYLDDGKMPFASATMASGFDLTNQQLLAAEQIELTVRESLGSDPTSYRELLKAWTQARTLVTPESLHDGDWATATPDEKEAAQVKHDFLFKMQAGGDARVNHLSRFAGLALASPALYAQLNQATYKDTRTLSDMKLGEAIGVIFRRLLDMFNGRMTKTYPGQNANEKVTILARQLVDNEAKHRRALADRTLTLTDRLEVRATKLGQGIFTKLEKAGRSDVLRNSRSVFVRAGGNLVSTVAGDRGEQLMTEIQKVHGRMVRGRQGMIASLVSEARGAHDAMTRKAFTLLREYAKTNEHERMKVSETTSRVALEGFENQGANLDKKQRAALTRIGMRTDLNALVGAFSLEEIEVLVRDQKARHQAIKDYENRLRGIETTNLQYYKRGGKDLGYRMATGHVTSKNLMHNAHNIAYLAGTRQFGTVSDAHAESVIEILDPLISLYALEYSPDHDRMQFSEILRHESGRGDSNGVRDMLKLYSALQEQAKETLFEGSPVHMVKGFTSEIYDPYRTLVAELDDEDEPNSKAKRLLAMGYTKLGAIEKDKTDPDQEAKALFVIRDGGAVRRVTGSLSFTDSSARGTALHGGLSMVSRDGINGANAKKNRAQRLARENAIDGLFSTADNYDPRKVKTGRSEMAPMLNKRGEITGYHYLMKEATKDKALARNNDFSSVLGAMAASNFDKPATKVQNRAVVKAMHEQYLADYHKRPHSYLRVGPDSNDPQLREYYNLLPHDTQEAVQEIWGERGMWIRSDVLDVTFGYQKWSLTEGLGLTKNAELRNKFQEIAAHFAETVFGPKVGLRIRRGEDFVFALVKEIKDFLVIKSGVTMLGNILSNMSLLLIAGVNPIKQVKLHREAIDSTLTYRRDASRLARLKALRSIEYVTDAGQDIEQSILALEDALSRSKAHRLVEAGLMPTIVEDVDQHEDPFSYQSQFGEWVDEKTSKVWSPLKTAAKTVYMTHDTPLYKLLSETTQMSDFVARYVMYEHTTTRRRNPLSHEDAVQQASEMFINYDIPTHRITQYLNDTGLLLFTKYYIRIQRALMTLFRDNPARFMLTALLNNMMPGLPTVLDSSALGRIGNPLDAGPLLYPEAVGEAMTVNAGMSLFK